ncbi:MAG: CotH kinase family protein, partial [Verrucomicrobiae bacterium]|nr:CotH kinase family protein [Verrucomicrobiae bacterium]
MGQFGRGVGIATVAIASLSLWCKSAGNGAVYLSLRESNLTVQIRGDPGDDWCIQRSTDLVRWVTVTNFGTLLSGGAKAPVRSVGVPSESVVFYRAVKTKGLFDPSLLRTFNLTFTQANWQTLLSNARNTGSNVYCSLVTLDNGATNVGVGARYRGNTSFTGMGGSAPAKKSINLETDFTVPGQDLMGYDTINLN